jgi:hypothetical protein
VIVLGRGSSNPVQQPAKKHAAPVATRNTRRFGGIPELELIDDPAA